MQENLSNKIYNAAVYVRLSKEDGDVADAKKDESDSISNQKSLIQHFISKQPNINLVEIFEDDGYSGVFFDNRPGFIRMLEAIEEGRVDTVIVKDLSRLGRNYVEVGRTVEEFLDVYEIRLISLNDNVDTMDGDEKVRDIIIPFLNILYEQYARDTSNKTRAALDTKCRDGQFIGSYAPYGYKKSETEKNKLEIDEMVAPVIKRIFKSYIRGLSAQMIARELQKESIPAPMDQKIEQGVKCGNGFKIYKKSTWDVNMVLRILKNEVYIGTLIQGKVGKRNFKQKKRYTKSEERWIRYEEAHEAIISKLDFMVVQQLLSEDVRRGSVEGELSVFAGKLFCADCGEPMHKRQVKSNGKAYVYYSCSSNKKDKKSCTQHNIAESLLLETVKRSIDFQSQMLKRVQEVMDYYRKNSDSEKIYENLEVKRLELEDLLQTQLERIKSLYEDVKDGLISKEEYLEYKEGYQQKAVELRNRIADLEDKIQNRKFALDDDEWIQKFYEYADIEECSRVVVAQLIRCIMVDEDKRVRIIFNFNDQICEINEFVAEQKVKNAKEAV